MWAERTALEEPAAEEASVGSFRISVYFSRVGFVFAILNISPEFGLVFQFYRICLVGFVFAL